MLTMLLLRLSTDGQTVQNQLGELRQVAERHGWRISQVYADEGISGTKRGARGQSSTSWSKPLPAERWTWWPPGVWTAQFEPPSLRDIS
jgi:hypothetical protein